MNGNTRIYRWVFVVVALALTTSSLALSGSVPGLYQGSLSPALLGWLLLSLMLSASVRSWQVAPGRSLVQFRRKFRCRETDDRQT